jgi:NAD-dependent dihydropyrimidine dehydrogenase PreA subunit
MIERREEFLRMPGEFIDIHVDAKIAKDATLAKKLAEICPVSIFESDEANEDGVRIDESNLDECVLCDLCVQAAPKGTIKIVKLYE